MPVQDFDIVGSFNNQRVIPFDPERSVNLFEYNDSLGKKPKALISTSGLKNTNMFFPGTPSGGFRNQFVFQAVGEIEPHEYLVIGFKAYRVDLAQNANNIFTFTSSSNTTYVGTDANTHQVIFVDGTQGWIYDTITNTAVQITDPGFPKKPIDVCNLDGFFVVADGDTNNFYLSSINQGLIWSNGTSTFTMAAGSSDIVLTGSLNANYQVGTPVTFSGGGLPAEIIAGTIYFVVSKSGTNIIRVSATQGGSAIVSVAGGNGSLTNGGQVQIGSITSHPGNIVACRTLHRRLFLFSQNFTEVWENLGAGANLPFRRNNSLLIEYGTPALGSIATGFDKMFFLSQDKDGLGAVMEVLGTQAVPASTKALDFILSNYAELNQVSDARAFLIKDNGVIFYRLNFTAANHSWIFDASFSDLTSDATKYWHEEEVLNGDRHPAQTHAYFGGINYVGHYSLPILYIIDDMMFTNDGEAIRRMRISRSFVPQGYQRIRIDRFQLDLLQGSPFAMHTIEIPIPLLTEDGDFITTEDGTIIMLEQTQTQMLNNDSPVVYLSYSKDGGQTFGYLIPAPMGKIGERSFRTLWRKLGTVPRGQGFVVKIEFFDDFPFQVLGAAWAMDVLPE